MQICGFSINPISLPGYALEMAELLRGTPFNGHCFIYKNTSVIRHVNNTVIKLVSNTEPLQVAINEPNLYYDGSANCSLAADDNLKNNIGLTVGLPLNQLVQLNLTFQFNISITAVSTISLNGVQSEPNTQKTNSTVVANVSPFNSIPALKQFDVHETLVKLVQEYIQNSPIPEAFIKFINGIIKKTFEVVNRQCSLTTP
ncbi:hypothetical protein CHUAL_006498 [Chamberlinius hualienensis]